MAKQEKRAKVMTAETMTSALETYGTCPLKGEVL